MTEAVLALDLGTSSCKAAVLSARGELLGHGQASCALLQPQPGWVEQEPEGWWRAAREAAAMALAAARHRGAAIRSIGLSSQGISFLPVSEAGRPLGNAICWLDKRAVEQARAILEAVPAGELFARTGKRASPAYVLPKLLWLREQRPELFAGAAKFLLAHDFLLQQLTGEQLTDHTLASGTMLYSICQQEWDEALLKEFAIPGEKLPDLRWSGRVGGQLRPVAATELGLAPGLPVAVGGQDQKLAAIGAGIEPGRATVSLGTAAAISILAGEPVLDPQMRIPVFSFCWPSAWDLEAVVGTAGASLAWLRALLAGEASFAELDAEAERSAVGANGVRFHPHLAGATGPHWQESGRGAFTGLCLATTRGDLVRAVLEGVAFELKLNLSVLAELAGEPQEVILFGGGARSRLWPQLLADVLGRPLAVAVLADAAALGAAMLAAVAVGMHSTLAEAQRAMAASPQWLEPDRQAASAYQDVYAEYLKAQGALLAER